MRRGGAQLVDLSDPSATLKDRRLAWRVFRDGAFRYVGFEGTNKDPARVAFGPDRLDQVPDGVQGRYRIGLAKDTSPQDPVTNRTVEPVVFDRGGARDTLHCVLIHPLITEGMSQRRQEDRNVRVYRWVCSTPGAFGYDDAATVPRDLWNDLMGYVRGYEAPKAAECDLEAMRAGQVMEEVRQRVNAAAIGQIDSKTGSVSPDERVDLMCRKGEKAIDEMNKVMGQMAIDEMNKVMGQMAIDGGRGFYPATACK
eukprot:g153.t1